MERYIVRICFRDEIFVKIVDTKRQAEALAEEINKRGYRHHEGNAVRVFGPGQVRAEYGKEH